MKNKTRKILAIFLSFLLVTGEVFVYGEVRRATLSVRLNENDIPRRSLPITLHDYEDVTLPLKERRMEIEAWMRLQEIDRANESARIMIERNFDEDLYEPLFNEYRDPLGTPPRHINLIQERDASTIGKKEALRIRDALRLNPYLPLVFPTGSTPIPVYQELLKLFEKGEIDFNRAVFFNIDEYSTLFSNARDLEGLLEDPHNRSYESFMNYFYFGLKKAAADNPKLKDRLPKEENIYSPNFFQWLYKEKKKELLGFGQAYKQANGITREFDLRKKSQWEAYFPLVFRHHFEEMARLMEDFSEVYGEQIKQVFEALRSNEDPDIKIPSEKRKIYVLAGLGGVEREGLGLHGGHFGFNEPENVQRHNAILNWLLHVRDGVSGKDLLMEAKLWDVYEEIQDNYFFEYDEEEKSITVIIYQERDSYGDIGKFSSKKISLKRHAQIANSLSSYLRLQEEKSPFVLATALSFVTRFHTSFRFKGEPVPYYAITLGPDFFLNKEMVDLTVLVTGETKALALRDVLEDPADDVMERLPAARLRGRTHVRWVVDKLAAQELEITKNKHLYYSLDWGKSEVVVDRVFWLLKRLRKPFNELKSENFRTEGLYSLLEFYGLAESGENFRDVLERIHEIVLAHVEKYFEIRDIEKMKAESKSWAYLLTEPHPDDTILAAFGKVHTLLQIARELPDEKTTKFYDFIAVLGSGAVPNTYIEDLTIDQMTQIIRNFRDLYASYLLALDEDEPLEGQEDFYRSAAQKFKRDIEQMNEFLKVLNGLATDRFRDLIEYSASGDEWQLFIERNGIEFPGDISDYRNLIAFRGLLQGGYRLYHENKNTFNRLTGSPIDADRTFQINRQDDNTHQYYLDGDESTSPVLQLSFGALPLYGKRGNDWGSTHPEVAADRFEDISIMKYWLRQILEDSGKKKLKITFDNGYDPHGAHGYTAKVLEAALGELVYRGEIEAVEYFFMRGAWGNFDISEPLQDGETYFIIPLTKEAIQEQTLGFLEHHTQILPFFSGADALFFPERDFLRSSVLGNLLANFGVEGFNGEDGEVYRFAHVYVHKTFVRSDGSFDRNRFLANSLLKSRYFPANLKEEFTEPEMPDLYLKSA